MKKDRIDHVLYKDIRAVLAQARDKSYRTVNFIMVEAYWNVFAWMLTSHIGSALLAALPSDRPVHSVPRPGHQKFSQYLLQRRRVQPTFGEQLR